jgi:hypothetical protein
VRFVISYNLVMVGPSCSETDQGPSGKRVRLPISVKRAVIIGLIALVGWYVGMLLSPAPARRLSEPGRIRERIYSVIVTARLDAQEQGRSLRVDDLRNAIAHKDWQDWDVTVTEADATWRINAKTSKPPFTIVPSWWERLLFLERTVRMPYPEIVLTPDDPGVEWLLRPEPRNSGLSP